MKIEEIKYHIIKHICEEKTKEGLLKLIDDTSCFVTNNCDED